mmetsp:Transcript_168094/g.539839  ORF Transcript_168094/g.539839 Transcript_168094/m.539839 type:complete len:233 (-) Transcript_168094:920-1618(-)
MVVHVDHEEPFDDNALQLQADVYPDTCRASELLNAIAGSLATGHHTSGRCTDGPSHHTIVPCVGDIHSAFAHENTLRPFQRCVCRRTWSAAPSACDGRDCARSAVPHEHSVISSIRDIDIPKLIDKDARWAHQLFLPSARPATEWFRTHNIALCVKDLPVLAHNYHSLVGTKRPTHHPVVASVHDENITRHGVNENASRKVELVETPPSAVASCHGRRCCDIVRRPPLNSVV